MYVGLNVTATVILFMALCDVAREKQPAVGTVPQVDHVNAVSARNGWAAPKAARFATVTRAISASASFVRKA